MMRRRTERKAERTKFIAEGVSRRALPLADPADLDPLIERIGDATYVLLGEATHGTSEFYAWRAALSRRLIEERGFSFVGVEGDWPDCYRVNRYVKSYADSGDSARDVLHAFERWPTWMWANREVAEFAEWLRDHNRRLSPEGQAGFYGLDVYSLWESMHAVVGYLESVDPALASAARTAYGCFEPYEEDAQQYARATAIVPTTCEREAVAVLGALRRKATEYSEDGRDAFFNAEQNALVAKNAELYYRTMVRGGATSWNVRDSHMMETLERLMVRHGPTAKAIVWEHNTHIGDARFTDMARGGMFNVGQLVRQEHDADDVVLVGFGTHRGTVVAGEEWGAPMRRMRVPPASEGSFEHALHVSDADDMLLLFNGTDDGGITGLDEPIGHRAIGVVYDPRHEHWGNYVPTIVPRRYDAFIHIEETVGVDALHMPVLVDGEPPETFPSGM